MSFGISPQLSHHEQELLNFLNQAKKSACGLARRLGLPEEDGNEALQELAVRFLEKPHLIFHYDTPQKFVAVRNNLLNRFKLARQSVALPDQVEEPRQNYKLPRQVAFDPSYHFLFKQCVNQLQRLATSRELDVLQRFVVADLNFTEIAAELGITPQGVHKMFWSLVRKWREEFGNK